LFLHQRLHRGKRSKRLGTLDLSAVSNSPTRSLSSSVEGKSSRQVQPHPSLNPTVQHHTCATLLSGIGGVAPSHLLSCLRDPEREACPACPNETGALKGHDQVHDLHLKSHSSAFARFRGRSSKPRTTGRRGDAVRTRNSCVWENPIPGTTCRYGFRFAAACKVPVSRRIQEQRVCASGLLESGCLTKALPPFRLRPVSPRVRLLQFL
jgi:hypothetical protein